MFFYYHACQRAGWRRPLSAPPPAPTPPRPDPSLPQTRWIVLPSKAGSQPKHRRTAERRERRRQLRAWLGDTNSGRRCGDASTGRWRGDATFRPIYKELGQDGFGARCGDASAGRWLGDTGAARRCSDASTGRLHGDASFRPMCKELGQDRCGFRCGDASTGLRRRSGPVPFPAAAPPGEGRAQSAARRARRAAVLASRRRS